MPIKQLQLRGISRTPSDRASADGGLAESLNVHLDQGELAPTLPNVNISTDIYPATVPSGEGRYDFRIVYIHKLRGMTNYIGVKHDTTNHNYKFRAYGSSLSVTVGQTTYDGMAFMGNAVTAEEEMPGRFASIGNMLIAYTSSRPYYFLFKDGTYQYLGGAIPKPKIEVASFKMDNRQGTVEIQDEYLASTDDADEWNAANVSGNEHQTGLLSTIDALWDGVKLKIKEARDAGVFVVPFFLRYAVRLYDGSYIYASSPILCGGAETDNWMRARLSESAASQREQISLSFLNAFGVYLKGTALSSSWNDIVQSIDFFASTPIYTPAMDAKFSFMNATGGQWDNEFIFEGMTSDAREKSIRDEVFSKGQFYKVKSIELTDTVEMGKLTDGTLRLLNSDSVSGDALLVQDTMPESYRDGAVYIPEADVRNYNNRLLLCGAKELLSRGDTFLNGQVAKESWGDSLPGHSTYVLRYTIVDSSTGKSHKVLAHYRNDGESLHPTFFKAAGAASAPSLHYGNDTAGTGVFKRSFPYAWLCYPDARCTQVEVFCSSNYYGKVVPMEPHPYLDCACAFLGYGVKLSELGSAYSNVATPSTFTEDREVDAGNKIYLSELENPFLFPAQNIVTFPDKVIGVAAITVPLSEGQVGEFNVYAFTQGGIRVLVTTAEGTFAASLAHPDLSRHVALPGTILSMEQAVVFITERGVMLLSGRSVTELSNEMNGAPFVMGGASGTTLRQIKDALSALRSPVKSIVYAAENSKTFMAFMRKAKPAYDFNGGRLIFFYYDESNPGTTWQYEYRLQTRSWHKLASGINNPTVLNSYPDCLVSHYKNSANLIEDFSTVLDDASVISDTPDPDPTKRPQPTPCLIVTRPFDLGEPDIRKAIRSIRIRGRYNRGDVRYLLLGSFDGINWKWMKSLRGGSYKQFRLIVLAKLMAMERITWIDVDYETRFTNRLR